MKNYSTIIGILRIYLTLNMPYFACNIKNARKLMAVSKVREIYSLLSLSFSIPSYQRGYRWSKDEVRKLIDDIYCFTSGEDDSKYYCLQPLVVQKKNDMTYEVIDGQQRLTTVFIIMKYLYSFLKEIENEVKTNKFSGNSMHVKHVHSILGKEQYPLYLLEYETRKNSRQFLEDIENSDNSQNDYIDYHYMRNAYMTIKEYLDKKLEEEGVENIIRLLAFIVCPTDKLDGDKYRKNVRFIWYDVSEECYKDSSYSKKLFSRLNIGKIALTNSELIKAVFLNGIHWQLRDSQIIQNDGKLSLDYISSFYDSIDRQLQYRIAFEWDMVDQNLHNPDFWAFLTGKDASYSTRIDFLFDILTKKNPSEKSRYYTFTQYDERFRHNTGKKNEVKNPEDIFSITEWKKVMDLFYTFTSWFNDRKLYHYIGFLSFSGDSISELVNLYEKAENHDDFINKLFERCKNKLSLGTVKLEELEYGEDDEKIRKVLMLFNIESINRTKSEERFSFSEFYTQNYDIEHIKPQTPMDYSDSEAMNEFAYTCLEYLTGIKYPEKEVIQRERYEDALRESCKNDVVKLDKVNQLLDQRGKENIFSSLGRIHIENIDESLRNLVPGVRVRTIKKEECDKRFLYDVAEYLKNQKDISKGNYDLLTKLNDYLTKGTHPGFSPEDKNVLGIEKDAGPNSIGNLVLLDCGTNRSYKNALFIVKRYFIHEREKEGVYVPKCTANVFNKMYSNNVSVPMKWTEDDMKDYVNEIKEVLNEH